MNNSDNFPFRTIDPEGDCVFKVGDTVYYTPSLHGYGWLANLSPQGRPELGQPVKIAKILKNTYIVYEGYKESYGGIHWHDFSATPVE